MNKSAIDIERVPPVGRKVLEMPAAVPRRGVRPAVQPHQQAVAANQVTGRRHPRASRGLGSLSGLTRADCKEHARLVP